MQVNSITRTPIWHLTRQQIQQRIAHRFQQLHHYSTTSDLYVTHNPKYASQYATITQNIANNTRSISTVQNTMNHTPIRSLSTIHPYSTVSSISIPHQTSSHLHPRAASSIPCSPFTTSSARYSSRHNALSCQLPHRSVRPSSQCLHTSCPCHRVGGILGKRDLHRNPLPTTISRKFTSTPPSPPSEEVVAKPSFISRIFSRKKKPNAEAVASQTTKPKKKKHGIGNSILNFTVMFVALGVIVSAISATQLNKHAVVGHYSKTALHDETTLVFASAIEQMSAVGLIDVKLVAEDAVKEIYKDLEDTTEDLSIFVMHEKELGGLIGAYRAFGDAHLPSTKALPTNFDPEKDQESKYEFFQRQTLRKQVIQLHKDLEDVVKHATDGYRANSEMIKMFLHSYVEYTTTDDQMALVMRTLNSAPLMAFERTLDILFLRNNIYPDLFYDGIQKAKSSDLSEKGTTLTNTIYGASLPLSRFMKNLDTKYVYQFLPPDLNSQYVRSCPFYSELANIPKHILDHPDRSMTGPLFEYYYNIFCRNQYHNMLVDEIEHLKQSRQLLLATSPYYNIQKPDVLVDGENFDILGNDNLRPLLEPALSSLRSVSDRADIASPLFPIPAHFLASTGLQKEKVEANTKKDLFSIPSFQNQTLQQQLNTLYKRGKKHIMSIVSPTSDENPLLNRFLTTVRYPEDLAHTIDTTSILKTFGLKDVPNRAWTDFDSIPPLYYSMSNTSPESDEVCRVLTKIDTCIIRNQLEIKRLREVANESYQKTRELIGTQTESSGIWDSIKFW